VKNTAINTSFWHRPIFPYFVCRFNIYLVFRRHKQLLFRQRSTRFAPLQSD